MNANHFRSQPRGHALFYSTISLRCAFAKGEIFEVGNSQRVFYVRRSTPQNSVDKPEVLFDCPKVARIHRVLSSFEKNPDLNVKKALSSVSQFGGDIGELVRDKID